MKLIRRLIYWFQMRSLEITLHSRQEAMLFVTDTMTLVNMEHAQDTTRRELARVRGRYNATFRPGIRQVWSDA